MIDERIQTLIAQAPVCARTEILAVTEKFIFITDLHNLTTRIQEVGAVRRGEEEVQAIELLIIPLRKSYTTLERRLASLGLRKDLSSDYAWVVDYFGIPVVIWIASKETFVEHQLLRTGPPAFVAIVAEAARAKGFTLDKRGFRKGRTLIMPFSEADIFSLIGLPYVPPQEQARFASEWKEN